MFAQTFSAAGEKQEKAADKETAALLKRFEGNPDVEKAKVDFDRAQEVEERFHKDFGRQDFTNRYPFPACRPIPGPPRIGYSNFISVPDRQMSALSVLRP